MKNIFLNGLAFLAGATLTLSFAPYDLFPLAIVAPAILLALWLNISAKKAAWRGWLFGLGFFGTGVHWVFHSIYVYGDAPFLLAAIITALFIAVLAFFPALLGYWLNRFFPYTNYTKTIYAFPALWVLLEWIRSWLFSGFPWLLLGYSQIATPLKGYAPLLSVYGVSLAVVICSGLLVQGTIFCKRKKWALLGWNLFVLCAIWIVGLCLADINWTKPLGQPTQVSLVQGNIPQMIKWSSKEILPTLERYKNFSEQHWDSKIIVWPESAIPITLQDANSFLTSLSKEAAQHHTALITGIPIEANNERTAFYNAVITVGNGMGFYQKHRLVPFGEYVPMARFFQHFLNAFHIPMSSFIPDQQKPSPLLANGIKIAAFICYEIAYPEQVLSRDNDIGMLLAVSNDGWFGKSIASAQHLQMAQMRALEMGRPLLFSTNNGITAIIEPDGKIQSSAPSFESYVLTDSVQAMHGKTPWQSYAMDPILLMIILLVVTAVRKHHKV